MKNKISNKLKKQVEKAQLLKELREALITVNVGYPWYGVPEVLRKATKFIKNTK